MLNVVLTEGKEVIMAGDMNCNHNIKSDNKALKDIVQLIKSYGNRQE